MVISSLLFTLSIALLIFHQATATDSPKPDLVIEIFRHGARGPLNQTFDPNPSWGNELGQLTPVGMRMHYLLGAAMRENYKELLENYEQHQDIYAQSTNIDRSIMSANSHLDGFCGQDGEIISKGSLAKNIPLYHSPLIQGLINNLTDDYALPNKRQITTLHVGQAFDDIILTSLTTCSNAVSRLVENALDPEPMDVLRNDLGDVVSYLQSKGLHVKTFFDLFIAGDNAICNLAHERELPGNIDPTSQYYQDLKFAFEWYSSKNVDQIRLNSLGILQEFVKIMHPPVISGPYDLNLKKFIFLSEHDTTLITLLNAFGIMNKDCLMANYRSQKQNKGTPYPHCVFPQFASNIIFEFYHTSEPYVKFLYDGTAVPFCGSSDNTCTYNQFSYYIGEIMKNYTSGDNQELCEFPEVKLAARVFKLKIMAIVFGIICFLAVIALLFVLFREYAKRSERERENINWMTLSQDNKKEETNKQSTNDTKAIELSASIPQKFNRNL